MSRNNDVFQVLVTKGNSPVLNPSLTLDNLAVGQIGVFDSNTNKSVDGSSPVKKFFLAVGVDTDGDGTVDTINTSAGSVGGTIDSNLVEGYSFRPHTAPRPQIIEVSDFKAGCDTEYAIKIEFRNQRNYRLQGYVPFSHTYVVKTSCCDGCEDCPSGDCNELVKLFVDAINLDERGLVVAEAVDGNGTVITDMDAFIATNAAVNSDSDNTNDVCAKIRLTSVPLKVNNFCNVNVKYYKPRQTTMIVSLVEGFGCSGKVETTQDAAFEEGNGYDVKQREYKAGGWNGRPGPYKTLTSTGLANEGFAYFADANTKYDQIALTYDNKATGGWLEYVNDLATEIAIPESDTVTRDSLLTVLDAILTPRGFDALLDDAAIASTDPTVTKSTSAIDNTNLDGIG